MCWNLSKNKSITYSKLVCNFLLDIWTCSTVAFILTLLFENERLRSRLHFLFMDMWTCSTVLFCPTLLFDDKMIAFTQVQNNCNLLPSQRLELYMKHKSSQKIYVSIWTQEICGREASHPDSVQWILMPRQLNCISSGFAWLQKPRSGITWAISGIGASN